MLPTLPSPRALRAAAMVASAWLCLVPSHAAEGMWTLDNLPLDAIRQQYHTAPTPEVLQHMVSSSLQVNGGCSGSFVSGEGLALTNHHCVVGCVADLSTPESDLVSSGFLAKDRAHERRCPDFELSNLERISDVTPTVQAALDGKTGQAQVDAMNAVRAQLTSQCKGDAGDEVRCDLVTLYHGGRYALHRFKRYTDVRLVWAPQDGIAAFGGDPDNFNFPRYALDAGLLRAYENGKPAVTPNHLRVERAGPRAGEPLYVVGNPGHTDRQLTHAQFVLARDRLALRRLPDSHEFRGLMLQYGKTGAEDARVSDPALRWTENGIKVMHGQLSALLDADVMKTKAEEEAALRAYFDQHKPADFDQLGDPWQAIAKAVATEREIADALHFLDGRGLRSDYLRFARTLVRGAAERAKPDSQRLPQFADNAMADLLAGLKSDAPIYPKLEKATLAWSLGKMREVLGADDALVKQLIGKETVDAIAARMVDGTKLGSAQERMRLWEGGQAAIAASSDPFIVLARTLDAPARALHERMQREVTAVERLHATRIAQARFARDGDSVYPDATGSLRLSYGHLDGWKEGDKTIPPGTDFAGLFRRYTGAAPFDLPADWLSARERLNPNQRFNFSSTNDIIGGNSGSPVINNRGELVGLAFDGNLHSTAGTYVYDGRVNRTVAVDAGAIVEALDKVFHAEQLVHELGQ